MKNITDKERKAIEKINSKFLQLSAEMKETGAEEFEIDYTEFAVVFSAMSEESVKEYAKRVYDYFIEDTPLLEPADGYDPVECSDEPHIYQREFGNKIIYCQYNMEARSLFGYEFWKDNSELFPDEYPGVDTWKSFSWTKTKH